MNRIYIIPSDWLAHLPQWAQELLRSPLFYGTTICIALGTSPLWAPGLRNLPPFRSFRIWTFGGLRLPRPLTLVVFLPFGRRPLEPHVVVPAPLPVFGPEEDPLAHIPDMEDDGGPESPIDRTVEQSGYFIMDPLAIAHVNSTYGNDFSQVPLIRLTAEDYPINPWIWHGYQSPEEEATEDDDSEYYNPLPGGSFLRFSGFARAWLSQWFGAQAAVDRNQRNATLARISEIGITGIFVEAPNEVVQGNAEDPSTQNPIERERSLSSVNSDLDSSAISERLLVSTFARHLSQYASPEDDHESENESNSPIAAQPAPVSAPDTQETRTEVGEISFIENYFANIRGDAPHDRDGPFDN
ncbi:hypothetical protein N7478_004108 [Penicillium angulare]|uniref:uncharacterized protein n=1 Tax=Penicillium angulare TaxID=116970 RepID=UPI00254056B6|nr:uncharacterized protein N7478_004108 [Penicillium angulare]KAJ5278736.1 hypothetical protein N7478_004108 [Penicillium angulare]